MLATIIRRLFNRHAWIIEGDTRRCTRCGKRQEYVPDCGGVSTGWWQDVEDQPQEPTNAPGKATHE
jgi:hypothetical protein